MADYLTQIEFTMRAPTVDECRRLRDVLRSVDEDAPSPMGNGIHPFLWRSPEIDVEAVCDLFAWCGFPCRGRSVRDWWGSGVPSPAYALERGSWYTGAPSLNRMETGTQLGAVWSALVAYGFAEVVPMAKTPTVAQPARFDALTLAQAALCASAEARYQREQDDESAAFACETIEAAIRALPGNASSGRGPLLRRALAATANARACLSRAGSIPGGPTDHARVWIDETEAAIEELVKLEPSTIEEPPVASGTQGASSDPPTHGPVVRQETNSTSASVKE